MSNRADLHVVFGGGPLGLAVIEKLAAHGRVVRLITRSGRADVPTGVEAVPGDVSAGAQATEATRGAGSIYHCVGADYGHWSELLPPIMAGVMHVAEATGARLVYGDNLYTYAWSRGPKTKPKIG